MFYDEQFYRMAFWNALIQENNNKHIATPSIENYLSIVGAFNRLFWLWHKIKMTSENNEAKKENATQFLNLNCWMEQNMMTKKQNIQLQIDRELLFSI